MKHCFYGLVAVLTVLGYADAYGNCASCSSCPTCGGKRVQTIHITPGDSAKSAGVYVNKATQSGNSGVVAPTVRVSANGGVGTQYVGGVSSTVDADVRAPDRYVVQGSATDRNAPYDYRGATEPVDTMYYNSTNRAPQQSYRTPADNNYNRSGYQPSRDYAKDDMERERVAYDEPRYYDESRYYKGSQRMNSYGIDGLWYIGARLDLNLLSWKNKYRAFPADSIDGDPNADHDDYSFEPVIGGNIFAGYRFNPSWRADLEFGFTSDFSDSGRGFTFEMSAPYLMANGYYDFANGLYLGLGLGLAFPTISMDWAYFIDGNSSKTQISLAGAAMFGYSYHLSDSLILDLRYRFSGFNGPTLTREADDPDHPQLEWVKTKVGFIMDNTLSVGIRYEF